MDYLLYALSKKKKKKKLKLLITGYFYDNN